MKLTKTDGVYVRKKVQEDTERMYIFTDNCDRSSGNSKIPDDSEYSKRFGKTGLLYPSITSASIRGLDNAYPLTTQHWYNEQHKGITGRWHDSDFEEFKKVIDEDIEVIKKACIEKGYKEIVFPKGGVLNSQIAALNPIRTPRLFNYIVEKEIELKNFNNNEDN